MAPSSICSTRSAASSCTHSTRSAEQRWPALSKAKRHYARLSLPVTPAQFLTPLLTRVRAGVDAVAQAARSGVLRVDDEDPEVTKLRAKIDLRIGEVQLPEVILAVDAQVRFAGSCWGASRVRPTSC
jgi:hypothetical protein